MLYKTILNKLRSRNLSINPPFVGQDDTLNQVLLCYGHSLTNIYSLVTEKRQLPTQRAVL